MGDAVGDDGVYWVALGEGSKVGVVPEAIANVEGWYLFNWCSGYAVFVGECRGFDSSSEFV